MGKPIGMATRTSSLRPEPLTTLRGTVFAAIGLLLAPGCADRVYPDDGPAGDDGADDGDDGLEDGDDGNDNDADGDDGNDADGDDGDDGNDADGDGDGDGDDGGEVCTDDYDNWGVTLVCVPDSAACGVCVGECKSIAENQVEEQWGNPCGGWEESAQVLCGWVEGDDCCQWVQLQDIGCAGRPFTLDGQPQVAAVAERTDWLRDGIRPNVHGLSAAERRRAADHWGSMAQAEHASVASFARFAVDLMAMGAPPELLVKTQRAMLDEVEHARLCFGLSSAYAGAAVGPDVLPVSADAWAGRDAERIVVDAVVEGCIEETISAALAARAAARAKDPVLASVLRKIARDEERHSALAWSFLRWALQRHPELAPAVANAFESASRAPVQHEDAPVPDGWLTARERETVAAETWREIIAPAARMASRLRAA